MTSMKNEPKYIKFVDQKDDRKYYIYELVRGTGDMATYSKGSVIGKKTVFDVDSHVNVPVPINALKLGVHRGMKFVSYETLDEIEADLFMEAFMES
jgi:hypothetical protein